MLNPESERKWYRFQGFLIKKIIGEKPSYKDEKEWDEERHQKSLSLADKYGEEFRKIIEENSDVYSAVMDGRYEDVAQKVIQMSGIEIPA